MYFNNLLSNINETVDENELIVINDVHYLKAISFLILNKLKTVEGIRYNS